MTGSDFLLSSIISKLTEETTFWAPSNTIHRNTRILEQSCLDLHKIISYFIPMIIFLLKWKHCIEGDKP